MTEQTYRIYEAIISNTDSALILFFIILALFLIPFSILLLKDRKERNKNENLRHERYIERERLIIEVIKENSTVIAGFKVVVESNIAQIQATQVEILTRLSAR